MPSLFHSCFDAPRHACVTPVMLDLDPDLDVHLDVDLDIGLDSEQLIADDRVSAAFAEAVLLYFLGHVHAIGFVRESADTRIVARWVDPASRTAYWTEVDMRAMQVRTNASARDACRGFGLAGICVALRHASRPMRERWTALLVHAQVVPGLASLTTASVRPIARTMADALRAVDRSRDDLHEELHHELHKELQNELQNELHSAVSHADVADIAALGDRWRVIVAAPDYTPPDVDDLKDRLLTADDFLDLLQDLDSATAASSPSRFQGPQLRTLQGLIRRRTHTVLLGPPGAGKSLCAFDALALERFATRGVDYQLFIGHDDVKASDLLGAWQPTESAGLFRWVPGPLVRAMTAHAGRGQPILVEEFLRMPRRAQNVFITALSDRYLVLHEKPGPRGEGELIDAGPDFVFLADMNMDASADDLELYGAAFASRVRKIVFGYPSADTMLDVIAASLPMTTAPMREAIVGTYMRVLSRVASADVTCPISPRACIQWAEEIVAALPSATLLADSLAVRTVAAAAAHTTWLTDVAGFATATQQPLLDDIEAQFRKAFGVSPAVRPAARPRTP